MEFFKVKTLADAGEAMTSQLSEIKRSTIALPIEDSLGQILAEDVIAKDNLPSFNRSTVDGFAVRSANTTGSGEFSPSFFRVIGSVEMGKAAKHTIDAGEAVYIPTGGQLPRGADAVVMIEHTERFEDNTIAVYSPAAPYSGVMREGEDIAKGKAIAVTGSRITPAMIGGFAALGYGEVKVYLSPTIAYFSTGDEIVLPPVALKVGQVWDITRYTVDAVLSSNGIKLSYAGHIPDDFDVLNDTLKKAVKENDIVILSGGSSVGVKDMVSRALENLGGPGVLVHGILMKPGKPTIGAMIDDCFVFGLPGHPGASLMVMLEFVMPFIMEYSGMNAVERPKVKCKSSQNLAASDGRRSYCLTKLLKQEGDWYATPIFGKSGAITGFAQADGFITIPEGAEGVKKDDIVEVTLF